MIASAVEYAKGKLDTDMQAVVICEAFGWTFDEYQDQPLEFLMLIKERMKIDAQRAEQQAKAK